MSISVPFTSHIEDRVLVTILDELKMVTNPFVGMRVYLRGYGRSIKILSVNERKEITGYYILDQDNTDEIIQGYFPLLVKYDITPSEPVESGSEVKVTIGNFNVTYLGESARIYNITVNGVSINDTFTETITESKKYSITVEAKGFIAYIEREVVLQSPTYLFFSKEINPRNLKSLSGRRQMQNGLYYDKEVVVNSLDEGYLWVVSAFRPEYVKTSEDPAFAIEGKVYLDSKGVVYWRSNDMLLNGRWLLTVR